MFIYLQWNNQLSERVELERPSVTLTSGRSVLSNNLLRMRQIQAKEFKAKKVNQTRVKTLPYPLNECPTLLQLCDAILKLYSLEFIRR